MSRKKYNYTGKKFEQDFENSIPENIYYYRLRNSASKWYNHPQICDYFLYKTPILYMLELKTVKGISLPFSNISENQINGLYEASALYDGVVSGIVVHFHTKDKTYFASAEAFKPYADSNTILDLKTNKKEGRKSYPIEWFETNGIEIINNKKISRYNFDVKGLINTLEKVYSLKRRG